MIFAGDISITSLLLVEVQIMHQVIKVQPQKGVGYTVNGFVFQLLLSVALRFI